MPQFIDVEDKIFGPFTLKQFIYLAGGASVGVVCVIFFWYVFWPLIASPIVILALALAFYKVNNRPFVFVMESAFRYFMKDKLYIWQKKEEGSKKKGSRKKNTARWWCQIYLKAN